MNSFKMSDQVDLLFSALCKAQGEMKAVQKENHGHRHKYADINTVIEVIRPVLFKNGLSIQQHPSTDSNGNAILTSILCHVSGQYSMSSIKLMHDSNDIQSLGSSITYTRRYALVGILGLEQEDDDGNSNTKIKKDDSMARNQVAYGNMIKPEQLKNLNDLIRANDNDNGDLLEEIQSTIRYTPFDKCTERQYFWVINKFFKDKK